MSGETPPFWNQKTFCLITGASGGIGKAIAIEFSKRSASNSMFMLVGRNSEALEDVKRLILKESGKDVKVVCVTLDLNNPDGDLYQKILLDTFRSTESSPSEFNHAILVLNAATFTIRNTVSQYTLEESVTEQRSLVHLSSSGVTVPYKSWGLYCAAKAARDSLVRSIALENNIQGICWSPGVTQTPGFEDALKLTKDSDLVKTFREYEETGKILTPQATVSKLASILGTKKFTRGEYVHYFDA